MNEIQNKPNDWLVATVSNPDLGLANFSEAGLNADNTQLKGRDFYKSKQFIQDTFQTEDGKFDEDKFNKAYDNALTQYEAFSTDSYDKSYLDQLDASFTNSFRKKDSPIRDERLRTAKVENPFRQILGLHGVGSVSENALSISEIAQKNKVFDFDAGKFLDWSPNDKSGIQSFFRSPLVLAQWEEDGEHKDLNGRTIRHRKGDFKYNDDGDVYYETLGNRDASKKQFLSSFDTLTIDGSMANKFDVFDTDDKEQSIYKAVARMGLKWAPLLLAGVASGGTSTIAAAAIGFNKVYLGTTALMNLAEALPMLYKASEGIFTDNDDMGKRSGLWNAMNSLQAKTSSTRIGTSEYSKNKTFTWENSINMISDVMLQLGQQRFIAEIPRHLGLQGRFVNRAINAGKNPYEGVKKFNDFSSSLATYYMTVTSGADAYNTAIEAGNSERTAGLLTLGTLVGLHQIMKSDIGQWGLKGIGLDDLRVTLKPILREEAAKAAEGHMIQEGLEAVVKGSTNKTQSFIQGVGSKVAARIKGFIDNPQTFVGAMVNESVEEVSEEMTQDLVFGLGKAAEALGITRKSDWDWFETDIINRYAMSAFGGAIGGGMHHVNWNSFRGVVSSMDEKTKKDIIYATYKYGSSEVNKMIDKMYKDDQLAGSKTLGVTPQKDSQGKTYFVNSDSEENSQAYVIREQLKNTVNTIEQLLSQTGSSGLDLDARRALNPEGDEGLNRLEELGLTSVIASDLLSINTEILGLEIKVKDLEGPDGTGNGGEFRDRLNELILEKKYILSGERFDEYFQYGLLYLNPELASQFTVANKNDMAIKLTGKQYDSLSEVQKEVIDTKYLNFQEKQQEQLKLAVNILNKANQKIDPRIAEYNGEYKKIRQITHAQLSENIDNLLKALQILDSETGEMDAQKLSDVKGMPIVGSPLIVDNSLTVDQIVDAIQSFRQSGLPMDHEISKVFEKAIDGLKTVAKTGFQSIVQDEVDEILPIQGDIILQLKQLPVVKQIFDQSFDVTEFNASQLSLDIEALTESDIFDQIKESTIRSLNVIKYDEDGDIESSSPYFAEGTTEELVKDFKKYLKERIKAVDNVLANKFNVEIGGVERIRQGILGSVKNPIYSYLNDISQITGSGTEGLFNTLADEETRLNQKELTDYIVANGNNLEVLQRAIKDIEIAKILTHQRIQQDGYQSYGSVLNNYRKIKNSKNPPLTLVDMDTAMLISGDLDMLKAQIQFFIDLSMYNSSDKLREHKKIGAKFMSNFAKLFVEGDPNAVIQQFRNRLGFDLLEGVNEIISADFDGYNILTDSIPKLIQLGGLISDDFLNKSEVFLNKLEDKLFENFQKHLQQNPNVDLVQLFKTLTKDIFVLKKNDPQSIVEGATSDLTSLPDKQLTDFDKLVYISTIFSSKSSDFKTILKNHIENLPEDSQIAPIFGQEYPARIAMGVISNPEIFNAALNSLQNEKGLLFYPMVQNLLFINGSPGTGKTSATASLIHSVVKALGKDFTISSIIDRQVATLKDSLQEDTGGKTKVELLNSILKGKTISDITDSDESFKSDKFIKEAELDKLLDNSEIGQVIYIDESTHYTAAELVVIGRWANKTGRVLITFGDTLQNGAATDIQFLSAVRSPVLDYSMRAGAVIVRDNNDIFRLIAKKLNDYELNKVDDNGNKLSLGATTSLQNETLDRLLKQSTLKYHETPNGIVTGVKLLGLENSTKDDLAGYINSIKTQSGNIGIIYDNDSLADFLDLRDLSQQFGIPMMEVKKMQGAEFDYVILSSDLSKGTLDPLVYAKLLNTLFSRAKLGVIAKNKGLNIANARSEYNDRQFIPKDVLDRFKENRLIPLDEISKNNPNFSFNSSSSKSPEVKKGHTEPPLNPTGLRKLAENQVIEEILGLGEYELESQGVESFYEVGPNGEKLNPSSIADNIGLMQAGYRTFGGHFDEDGNYILPITRNDKIGEKVLFDLQAFATDSDGTNITEISNIDGGITKQTLQDYDLFVNTLFDGIINKVPVTKIIEDHVNDFVNQYSGTYDSYDWDNAKIKILYSPANKTFDENYEVGGNSDKSYLNSGKIIKRVVIWVDPIDSSDKPAVLTVGSVMTKQADDEVSKLDKTVKAEINSNGFSTRILSPEAFEQTGSYTRIERKNALKFSLRDFVDNELRWKKVTKPMIFTGKIPLSLDPNLVDPSDSKYRENIENFLYNQSLNGRAFTFITYDEEFKQKSDKEISDYFFNQRIERIQRKEAIKRGETPPVRKYPGKITMVMLSPKSLGVKEFFDKFRLGIEDIKNGNKKALNGVSNRFLGLNILKSVYELNQYLFTKEKNVLLTPKEKAIKNNTWNILSLIKLEFRLECFSVKNSSGEYVTEVRLLDENIKDSKPLELSEDLLSDALAIKTNTKSEYRKNLYNQYYKKLNNLIDGKGFTDLLLFFSDLTNTEQRAVQSSITAQYYQDTLELAMTGKIGKDSPDTERKGLYAVRFPEGIHSHPIYKGDSNSNNITDWVESCDNDLSEFEVTGVRVESRRYKVNHGNGFVFTEENFTSEQIKKVEELRKEKDKILSSIKSSNLNANIKNQLDTIVSNKSEINKNELSKELNNFISGKSIENLNISGNNNPIISVVFSDDCALVLEFLQDLSAVDGISIDNVSIKGDEITIVTSDGSRKKVVNRILTNLEPETEKEIDEINKKSDKLISDINAYISKQSDLEYINLVTSLFTGTASFLDIKKFYDQMASDSNLQQLLTRKIELEC